MNEPPTTHITKTCNYPHQGGFTIYIPIVNYVDGDEDYIKKKILRPKWKSNENHETTKL